jgi:hypothetical protein
VDVGELQGVGRNAKELERVGSYNVQMLWSSVGCGHQRSRRSLRGGLCSLADIVNDYPWFRLGLAIQRGQGR